MRRWSEPTVVLLVSSALSFACATPQRGEAGHVTAIGESDMPRVAPRPRGVLPAPTGAAANRSVEGAAPSASAAQADGRVSLPDDFPAGTRSLQLREVAHVFELPSERARYIGKIVGGTRVAWRRVVAPDPPDPKQRSRPERCTAWVEIVPRGWLCTSLLVPSPDEPLGMRQPVIRAGRPTPDDYFKVMADDTKAFKSEDDVRADTVDKLVSTKVMLVATGVVHVDETPYMRTDHGLIEADRLARFWPSDFAGIMAKDRSASTFPFGWIFFERWGKKPSVLSSPDPKSAQVRNAIRREIVPISEERDGYVRIGEGEWIDRKYVRIARLSDPPNGVTGTEQWVDVDRDEQVLVAYEGKTPVFSTLVSTGGKKPTPVGIYRVRAKAATTSMDGDPSVPNRYEVSAVPWAVRFGDGLFIHGVYWHDGFGGPRSHGCVNVSPKDAAFLFDWIGPAMPDGWSEIEVPLGEGAIVRVRDREHPSPPVFEYSNEKQVLRVAPKVPPPAPSE
jgi:hypothetical protein